MDKKIQQLGEKLKEILKDDLICFALYGSAASGDFYKTSDYNTLIVLKQISPEILKNISKPIKNWCANKNPLPVIFTYEDLKRSTDVFPLEFIEIKKHHKIIIGVDCLKKLNISMKNLRQEIERELKSIYLHLLRAFLQYEKIKELKQILAKSISSFSSLLKGVAILLNIKGEFTKKTDVIEMVSSKLKLNKELFFDILKLKNDLNTINDSLINEIYFKYLNELKVVIDKVDKLKRR